MQSILIFGSTGSLGKILTRYLIKKKFKVFTDQKYKTKLKKNNGSKLFEKIIERTKPNYIVNLVALTNVDLCEKNKELANKSNNLFVKNLVTAIKKIKEIYLIHVSTDQVYSGKGNHIENFTKPVNFYGISKLKGEKHANKTPSTILRTNFVGKTKNKSNLCNWIYQNLKKKKKIYGYKNIYFSPVHTTTLVKLIEKVLKKKIEGIYNLGASNKISKAKFAERFALGIGSDKSLIQKINYTKKNLIAKRPLDMGIKIKKFEYIFKTKLPKVETEIIKLVKEYK